MDALTWEREISLFRQQLNGWNQETVKAGGIWSSYYGCVISCWRRDRPDCKGGKRKRMAGRNGSYVEYLILSGKWQHTEIEYEVLFSLVSKRSIQIA